MEGHNVGIVTDWEGIDTSYGRMRMYTARPDGGTAGPGVLIVHEAYGLTERVEEISRRFAEEGFVALAPDLYHRLATRVARDGDAAAAAGLRQQLSDEEVGDDLSAALRFLGARGEVRSGLVGVVGFGSGGRDAFRLATRNPDVLALVCYGASLTEGEDAPVEESGTLDAPSLFFFGEDDPATPSADVALIRDTLDGLGKDCEIVSYPGVGQSFFGSPTSSADDQKAASDAWTRTVDFLYQYLEG